MDKPKTLKQGARRCRRVVKWLLVVCALAACLVLFIHVPVFFGVLQLKHTNPSDTSFMKERAAEATTAGMAVKKEQDWIPLAQISPHLVRAVVAGEDPRFFAHAGFDRQNIEAALAVNWEQKSYARGASSISQQLAKNLFLSSQKKATRKLHEALITFEMERTLSKQRIMELYLNVIEWGDGIYGAEAASRHYFNTSAAALDEEQAAFLCALIPGPRWAFNPELRPDRVQEKVQTILSLMRNPDLKVGLVQTGVSSLQNQPD
jgi:monofunctional biosynthetic peptidoglycan transglycosylase